MTVYLDMDGVLADFFGGLEKRFDTAHWKNLTNIERYLDALKNTDFFYTLEPFREEKFRSGVGIVSLSHELVKFVNNLTDGDWGICSSPLRGDDYNSAYWKRRWLNKYQWEPPIAENLIFTANKHKYATSAITGMPNILVDDKPSNIDRWNQAGGIGIRYQANQDDLFEYLFPLLEEKYNER